MVKENRIEDERSSATHRAMRLKSLREMTGLSRDMFKKRYGIARGTLQNWETARFGGLTIKGAKIILRAFQAEGVQCSIEWLLHGVGSGPQFSDQITHTFGTYHQQSNAAHQQQYDKEIGIIAQELLYFRQNNTDAIDFVMNDDAMEPYYMLGYYVAGIRRYNAEIEHAVGSHCIVQTADYGTTVRLLKLGDEIGTYHLFALNMDATVNRPIIYNADVISAAPVIWCRKIDSKLIQKEKTISQAAEMLL